MTGQVAVKEQQMFILNTRQMRSKPWSNITVCLLMVWTFFFYYAAIFTLNVPTLVGPRAYRGFQLVGKLLVEVLDLGPEIHGKNVFFK